MNTNTVGSDKTILMTSVFKKHTYYFKTSAVFS